MKYSFTFLLLYISMGAFAQQIIEPCKFGQPLLNALQVAYTPDNTLGYGPARDILYSQIDNNGLELSGIYTNFTITLEPGVDPSISAFQNGNGLNAEHVYPQSLGAGDEPARSDLHNIFPAKVNVNETRGNCPFDDVEDYDTDKWFYLDMQLNNIPGTEINAYSEKDEEDCVFEPREEVKGNIARAMFYFYAIYQSIANNADLDFFPLQKETLQQWHLADPPDEIEIERNSLIALQQGNHNPFIIDGTLAWRAYFSADASYPEDSPDCYSETTAVPEPTEENQIAISSAFVQDEIVVYAKNNKGTVLLFDMLGQLIRQKKMIAETHMSLSDLTPGVYVLLVRSAGQKKSFLFFKD